MKFLIQKVNGKITHDFSFILLKSIEYQNWLHQDNSFIKCKFFDTKWDGENFNELNFKDFHNYYVPVGSVEFVSKFIEHFHDYIPKPLNVPKELFGFAHRKIFNGNHMDLENLNGEYFVKSNDKIKGYCEIIKCEGEILPQIPAGNYQISELINIDSEWRAFFYKEKLVGLQNYSGDFKLFPDPTIIQQMADLYESAPIAYTLDVGINIDSSYRKTTFIIEAHDFFSCSNYGMSNHAIYPYMLYKWFQEYLNKQYN